MQIKKLLLKIVPKKILNLIRGIFYPEKINVLEDRLDSLFLTYNQGVASPDLSQKTAFRNAEFKVYSKHGGDGLLLYIFSKIGTTNHTFVEMGIEDGRECNTTNLLLNFGWNGLLIDANKDWVESARSFFKTKLGDKADNVKIVDSFVTAENINKTLSDNNISGGIDLLSIDIDSNDYWVWESISTINPRVVVMEYNSAFGLRSLTIKYDPNFHYQKAYRKNPLYFGASLQALATLGKSKGYILVACDIHGHDAFFVRSDVAKDKFVELSAEEAFYPNPYTIKNIGDLDTQFEQVKHLDFEKI